MCLYLKLNIFERIINKNQGRKLQRKGLFIFKMSKKQKLFHTTVKQIFLFKFASYTDLKVEHYLLFMVCPKKLNRLRNK